MSDQQTEETTTAPADMTDEQRAEAADAIFESAFIDDDAPAEEPAEAAEEPAAEAAEAEPEPPAEEPEEHAEEPAEEPEDPELPPWRHAQAKRYKRQAERTLAEVQAERDKLAQMQAELAEQQKAFAQTAQLTQLAQQNPRAALEHIAKSAGMSPTQLYEQLTQDMVGGQLGGGESMVLQEVQALRAELAAQKEAVAQAQKEAAERAQKEQQQYHEAQAVNAVATATESLDGYAERWPYYAKLPVERRKAMAAAAFNDAWDNGASVSPDAVGDYLDKQAKREIDQWRAIIGSSETAESASNGTNGQGHRAPAQNGANAGHKQPPAALSNADAAATSGARRDMTDAERQARADELFSEAFAYTRAPD